MFRLNHFSAPLENNLFAPLENNLFAPGANNLTAPKGFLFISTLDNFHELGRALFSLMQHNSFPVHVIIARDISDAFRLKTQMAFHSPFKYTIYMDTDILVNGNLDELFALAETVPVGIVREKVYPLLNAGFIVFETDYMKKVCKLWNEKYEAKQIILSTVGKIGYTDIWDQDILNEILPLFEFKELPSIYNQILHDYTPEEELKIYDSIKVFHFLHHHGIDRMRYKSYQNYMSINPFELI